MNTPRTWKWGVGLLLGFLAGAGCTPHQPAVTPRQREAIQARTTHHFAHAVLFKPSEGGRESSLEVQLAPFIIQEVAQTNATGRWRDQLGSADSPLRVSGESGTIWLNNRAHQQFTYQWPDPASTPPHPKGRTVQGVRLTLNSANEPVIWEVLGDSSGAEILYVAQSLERAAQAEFGGPLPGRKFASERSPAETPNIVVANVIEDGPVAMGPMLYLQSDSRDVTALICRCMPSQLRDLLGQKDYELAPREAAMRSNGQFTTAPLEQRLRLPRHF